MKKIQDRLQYLLNQYTNGKSSSSEENELFALIDEAKNDDNIKHIMLTMMQDEEVTEMNKDWEPVLKKILDTAEIAKTAPASVYDFSERKKVISWKSVAAAAAIIFFVSAGIFYFAFNQNADNPVVIKNQETLPSQDITPPNSSNAILTLSNGLVIILDSAGTGTLAQQGTVSVIKLADGQIAYNPQGVTEHLTDEIMYNTLTNPAGSKVVNITLEDGTKVWLNSKSSLRYPTAFKGKERKVEITGEAYFEVAHIPSPSAEDQQNAMLFHVSANGVDVQVLGTHFNINSYEEEGAVKTTLLEGSVKVNKDGKSVLLKPGQQAQVNFSKGSGSIDEPISINTPDLEEVMAWKNGKFSFQNTDLETIMRQMARWYNVEVVYKDKINDHYTVNVSRNVPVSQLFKFIEMSGGVRFTIEDKKIIVKK